VWQGAFLRCSIQFFLYSHVFTQWHPWNFSELQCRKWNSLFVLKDQFEVHHSQVVEKSGQHDILCYLAILHQFLSGHTSSTQQIFKTSISLNNIEAWKSFCCWFT
jgi:hypothetical protein